MRCARKLGGGRGGEIKKVRGERTFILVVAVLMRGKKKKRWEGKAPFWGELDGIVRWEGEGGGHEQEKKFSTSHSYDTG